MASDVITIKDGENGEASTHQLAKKMQDCAGGMLGGEWRLLVELLRPPNGLYGGHHIG